MGVEAKLAGVGDGVAEEERPPVRTPAATSVPLPTAVPSTEATDGDSVQKGLKRVATGK